MGSDPKAKGDELGRTATAPGSGVRVEPAEPVGPTVGRYRLERELGEGGMGVVHAAFDPDLQRRVALKVLRVAASGAEAKDRLLREARAMARLAHTNVVTVHEVGTANGRDYIAMELIVGETLADWLRAEKRRAVDIVAAFVAAGRGLAAAHAAGVVHRDFKPHNVLRSRTGRIVVTDFGLAREAQAELPSAFEATLPLGSSLGSSLPQAARTVLPGPTTTSSLTGITVTGSLLGTPAYMAPEQWDGGLVTPATDQYAYCIGLWEALAGERPYRGPTLDDLRKQSVLGPSDLDASKIPRRLRPILRRGLDPEPAKRWPNMDALLARLVRAERRSWLALAIVGGAVAVAVIVALAMHAGGHVAAVALRCQPPALDPAKVWSAEVRAGLGQQAAAAHALDADLAAWTTARAAACKLELVTRSPRLSCLDGVLARFDAVARAAQVNRETVNQVDAGALLIDPAVCDQPNPPRLMTSTSPELHAVMATWLAQTATPIPLNKDAAIALVDRAKAEPCASSLAHLLAAEIQKSLADRTHQLDEAQQDAARCGDDRVLAEMAIEAARSVMGDGFLGAAITTKLRLAETAAQRVAQRDLIARIDLLRMKAAERAENLDQATERGNAAMAGFAARGRLRAELSAELDILRLQQLRGSPADLAAMPARLAASRKRAAASLGQADDVVHQIDVRLAIQAFDRGDVAGAHALLDQLRRALPNDNSRVMTGTVVDERGAPVAGATVTTGKYLRGDSIAAVLSISSIPTIRSTTTGSDGRFEISDAADDGIVIAQLGDRRSPAEAVAATVKLALSPTSRIEGRVDLAGVPPSNVVVVVKESTGKLGLSYALIAPIAADGSFALDGVPRREVDVLAGIDGMASRMYPGPTLTPHQPVVKGLALSMARSSRVVHVIVRNTVNVPLVNAEVVVFPGKVASTNLLEVNQQFRGGQLRMARQVEGEQAPRPVIGALRSGDLFATMTEVPEGAATACAVGLPSLSDDELGRKFEAHRDKVQLICRPIPEHAELVTVEVPPFPRLD